MVSLKELRLADIITEFPGSATVLEKLYHKHSDRYPHVPMYTTYSVK